MVSKSCFPFYIKRVRLLVRFMLVMFYFMRKAVCLVVIELFVLRRCTASPLCIFKENNIHLPCYESKIRSLTSRERGAIKTHYLLFPTVLNSVLQPYDPSSTVHLLSATCRRRDDQLDGWVDPWDVQVIGAQKRTNMKFG
jgi:hypothetical protein